MTFDTIAPEPRDEDMPGVTILSEGDDADPIPGHRVKVYDGLVVDPAGNPGTIGADSNGD